MMKLTASIPGAAAHDVPHLLCRNPSLPRRAAKTQAGTRLASRHVRACSFGDRFLYFSFSAAR